MARGAGGNAVNGAAQAGIRAGGLVIEQKAGLLLEDFEGEGQGMGVGGKVKEHGKALVGDANEGGAVGLGSAGDLIVGGGDVALRLTLGDAEVFETKTDDGGVGIAVGGAIPLRFRDLLVRGCNFRLVLPYRCTQYICMADH